MGTCSAIELLKSNLYKFTSPNVRAKFIGRLQRRSLAINVKNYGAFILPLDEFLAFKYEEVAGGYLVTLGSFTVTVDTEEEAKDIIVTIGRKLAPSKRRRVFKVATIAILLLILVNNIDGFNEKEHSPESFPQAQATLLKPTEAVAQAYTPVTQEVAIEAPTGSVLTDVGLDDPMHPN